MHPKENKTVVRNYSTVPPTPGAHAPDYLISTADTWNYALDLQHAPRFVGAPSPGWSEDFPFDDSGEFPFAVDVVGCEATSWGYWRNSSITAPPPVSPVGKGACGPSTKVRLTPFGSTNIRVSVFPHL